MRDASPRAAATAAALLFALSAGCDGRLCDAETLPTCDVRDELCQAQVHEAVACMRGSAPAELPPIEVLDVDGLEGFLRGGGDPEMMRSLQWERPLQMLRLFDPEGDLYEENVENGVASILAFYTWVDDKVVIVDRGEPLDSEDAVATLAHELVHHAQDQESDLQALFATVSTHEESLRMRSLVEGEATFYTYEAHGWMLGYPPEQLDWVALHESQIQGARDAIDASPSPYLTVYGLLPYYLGSRFAWAFWATGGDEAVRPLLTDGPTSSAWFLVDPVPVDSPLPPDRLAASPCEPPPVPFGYSVVDADEMGAPLIYAFLRRWGMTHAEAWSMALKWRRDDLTLYQDADGEVALAWRIVFDDIQAPRWVSMQISFGSDAFRLGYVEDTVTILTADDPDALASWTWGSTGVASCDPP